MDTSNAKDSYVMDDYESRHNLSMEQSKNIDDSVVDDVHRRQKQLGSRSFGAICVTLFCSMFILCYYYYCTLV